MNCTMYTQAESNINGRLVHLYLLSTPIGHFIIVDWEAKGPDKFVTRKIFDEDYDKAARFYKKICNMIVNETI